ncbi:Kinase [Hexamita inflata]|uniref:CMGC CLK n=1 Tax=Hexamita inflata TaxID=28002 RepID=A0AA86R6H0_9EUKA|nr:CMGC CLK [Hexamita inflata]
MEDMPSVQALVEEYLLSKCDQSLQPALRNLLKVVFYQGKSSQSITQLEILLQNAQQRSFHTTQQSTIIQNNTLDSAFYNVPPLNNNEMQIEVPKLELNVQEKSKQNCHSVNSNHFTEIVLQSERPENDPEQFSYIIVGPIDNNDYVLQGTFYDEVGSLTKSLEESPIKSSQRCQNNKMLDGHSNDESGEERSENSMEGDNSTDREDMEQNNISFKLPDSNGQHSQLLDSMAPEHMKQTQSQIYTCNDEPYESSDTYRNKPTTCPAKPTTILTPMKIHKDMPSKEVSESDSFIQDDGESIDVQISERVKTIIQTLKLDERLFIKMNQKLNFPLRCEYVRRICNQAEVPDVLQFLHSSFDIPVHYEVYNEYAGLLEFSEAGNIMFLAGRYIVIDQQYNSDGVFGEVMCAFDIIDREYVAIKRQKTPDAFSQLINEIRTLMYINSHDRVNNQKNFSLMKDFFIQYGCLFIVFEFLGENLYRLGMKYQAERAHTFSVRQLQYISRRVLESVQFLEQLGIQHFDLKPENIVLLRRQQPQNGKNQRSIQESMLQTNDLSAQLKDYDKMAVITKILESKNIIVPALPCSDFSLDDEIEVKLIDIGSHHFFNKEEVPYVQSRFYRAPEVILQLPYDSRTETFSWGSVLYELATRDPLFVTDVQQKFYQQQLANFIGLLGPIPTEMIILGQASSQYFTRQFKLFASGEQLVQNYDPRFTLQSQEIIETILNGDETAQFFYIEPLRINFKRFFREKLEQMGYFESEDQKEVYELIRFARTCMEVDMSKRPYVRDLLVNDPFLGGTGSMVIDCTGNEEDCYNELEAKPQGKKPTYEVEDQQEQPLQGSYVEIGKVDSQELNIRYVNEENKTVIEAIIEPDDEIEDVVKKMNVDPDRIEDMKQMMQVLFEAWNSGDLQEGDILGK